MDRQRTEGSARKPTGTTNEKGGQLIGERHKDRAEQVEERVRRDGGRAMDAIHEVVEKE
jgi:hypothetical protein